MASSRESSNRNKNEMGAYLEAIWTGSKAGLGDLINAAIHPLDEVLYPITDLAYDALIISAAHESHSTTVSPGSDPSLLQEMIKGNPRIYTDATDRMQQRYAGLKAAGHEFLSSEGARRAEMASRVLTNILVPGYFLKGVKVAKNIKEFGTLSQPPKFYDTGDVSLQVNLPLLKNIAPDLRNIHEEKPLLYVITEDKDVIVTRRSYPDSIMRNGVRTDYVHHPELAQLKPVYAAGEVTVKNGKIEKIDNHSGHYLPEGPHLEHLVTQAFIKQGYPEAQGKFIDVTKYLLMPSIKNPIMSQERLNILPSAVGMLGGAATVNLNEDSAAYSFSFLNTARASENDEALAEEQLDRVEEVLDAGHNAIESIEKFKSKIKQPSEKWDLFSELFEYRPAWLQPDEPDLTFDEYIFASLVKQGTKKTVASGTFAASAGLAAVAALAPGGAILSGILLGGGFVASYESEDLIIVPMMKQLNPDVTKNDWEAPAVRAYRDFKQNKPFEIELSSEFSYAAGDIPVWVAKGKEIDEVTSVNVSKHPNLLFFKDPAFKKKLNSIQMQIPARLQEVEQNTNNEHMTAIKKMIAQTKDGDNQQKITTLKEVESYREKIADEDVSISSEINEILAKEKVVHDLYAAQSSFSEAAGLGAMLGSKEFHKGGVVGQNLVKISASLAELDMQIPFLGEVMSYAGAAHPYLAAISAAVQIGQTLFGKPKTDVNTQIQIKYLQAILEGVSAIRNEMHQRHDITDQKILDVRNHLDVVYYLLKHSVQINHEIELRNMHHISKSLGEDTQHLQTILTSLIKDMHLDDLDKFLIEISKHKQGNSKNPDALLKANTFLIDIWLLKNLIGANYNGGIYSTDSTRQDKHFVGNEIPDPGSALGFLARYASSESGLNMGSEFAMVSSDKLPFVELWTHAVYAHLAGRLIATKKYEHSLDDEKIDELREVADNANLFVETAAEHATEIFEKLTVKYSHSMTSLQLQLRSNLIKQIKNSDKFYSLRSLSESGIVSLKELIPNLSDSFIARLLATQASGDPNIPLVLALAQKFDLGTVVGSYNLKRHLGYGFWDRSGPYVQRAGWCGTMLPGADLSISLSVTLEGKSVAVSTIKANKPQVPVTYPNSKLVGNVDSEQNAIAEYYRLLNSQTTDTQIISETQIVSQSVYAYIQTLTNDLVLEKIADHILEQLQSGKSLSDFLDKDLASAVSDLYSSAVTATYDDMATSEQASNTLSVTKHLAQAYGKLIGLSDEMVNAIGQHMISDSLPILNNPAVFNQVPSKITAILASVNEALPNRNSQIQHQMNGVIASLNDYSALVSLYNGYVDKLSAWRADVESFILLRDQLIQMRKIAKHRPDSSNAQHLAKLMIEVRNQRQVLNLVRKYLIDVHEQISILGFQGDLPETITTLFDKHKIKIQEQVLSEEPIEFSALDVSVTETARKLEEAIEYIDKLSCYDDGILVIGGSGFGKSTLINFKHGVDYKHDENTLGDAFLSPANNVPEVAETGLGRSVTHLPKPYENNGRVDIDMPGFRDTDGKEADIGTAVMALKISTHFKRLAIEAVITDAAIYDSRFEGVKDTLRKLSLIIESNPEELSKNVMITITKPSKDRLKNGDLLAYEDLVFKKLQHWLEKDIGKLPRSHQDYPIKYLLTHLKREQIMVVDPTNPPTRLRYQSWQDNIPKTKSSDFNFHNFDKDAVQFKLFIKKVTERQHQLQKEIETLSATLEKHWKERVAIQPTIKSELGKFSEHPTLQQLAKFEKTQNDQHAQLIALSTFMNNKEIANQDEIQGIIGDSASIADRLIYLMNELSKITPLQERLNYILQSQEAGTLGSSASAICETHLIKGSEDTGSKTSRFANLSEKSKRELREEIEAKIKNDDNWQSVYSGGHELALEIEEELKAEINAQRAACEGSAWPFPDACGEIIFAITEKPSAVFSYPFDSFKVDDVINIDKATGIKIYTLHYFKDGREIGTIDFFGENYLCFSPDKTRHNIVNTTGIFTNWQFTPEMGYGQCRVLPPPTFSERMSASVQSGTAYGFLRGSTNVMKNALETHGYSKQAANLLSQAAYYSSVFTWKLASQVNQMQSDANPNDYFNAMYAAAAETGQLWLMAQAANSVSQLLNHHGWKKLASIVSCGGRVAQLGIFASNTYQTGVAETAVALASGAVVETVTEQVGQKLRSVVR